MSEQGKGSLLLPLGIGAGIVMLYLGMKKKEVAAIPTTADSAALLPEVKEDEAAVPQINPAPAPSYAQVSRTTGDESGDDANDDSDDNAGKQDEDEAEGSQPGDESSEEDYDDGGSQQVPSKRNFVPTQRATIPATNRQVVPSPSQAYVPSATDAIFNKRQAANKTSLIARAAQPVMRMANAKRKALNFAQQKYRANMRPQNQQAVMPQAVAPAGTTQSASMPFVSITSNNVSPAPVAQATIFPLKFGTTSPYVKEVQRKIGVSATGYFGNMTRTAIQKRFRVNEISEVLYKQIITGKVPVPIMRKPITRVVHASKKPIHKKFSKVKHR